MSEESVRQQRLAQAQQDLQEIAKRVAALAAQIPEPVASVAAAIESLTPDQKAALRRHRAEALDVVGKQIVEERHQLEQLIAQHREDIAHWMTLVEQRDLKRMAELGPTMNRGDDEVGERRAALRELELLHDVLRELADPADPGGPGDSVDPS